MREFIFLGFKITADSDCSHEIKRHFLLGRKAIYDKPRQHIKKWRCQQSDVTLLTKVHLVKAMAFSVAMFECESWTIKKAEH